MAEIITRLQDLRHQYPDAVIHRGRANRWELSSTKESSPAE